MRMNKRKICNNSALEDTSQPQRSKYNVNKDTQERTYNGIVFDSAIEMKYYRDVVVPKMQEGEIVHCELQKVYILQPAYKHDGKKVLPIEYKADFYLVDRDGKESVIDIKGFPDAVALLKRKIFWYLYPNIDYQWISYSRLDSETGWATYEAIKKGRKERKKLKQKLKEKKDNEQ